MAGCAVGPDYQTPKVKEAVTAYSQAGVVTNAPAYQSQWWNGFGDPLLTRLVGDALVHNHDVRAATEQLRSVRGMNQETKWGFAPNGSISGGYQRKKLSSISMPGAGEDIRNFDLFDAGFDAVWELDVFGKVRRMNEASSAGVAATKAQRDAVLISVAAETVRNYLELRSSQQQLKIALRNAQIQEESLRQATLRWEAGKGRGAGCSPV